MCSVVFSIMPHTDITADILKYRWFFGLHLYFNILKNRHHISEAGSAPVFR